MQLVGLEGEHPFVVVQREAGDGVGAHVREIAGHHAVLGELCPPLPRVEQVPLVGSHERVHADIRARLLVREERGDVALVEFRRPMQRHRRPDRLAGAAEPGAAEASVDLLQIIR